MAPLKYFSCAAVNRTPLTSFGREGVGEPRLFRIFRISKSLMIDRLLSGSFGYKAHEGKLVLKIGHPAKSARSVYTKF